MKEKTYKDPLEGIDFSDWEKLYSRPLEYFEKLEIKTNCIDFAKLLIKEDLRHREQKLTEHREKVRSLLGSHDATT